MSTPASAPLGADPNDLDAVAAIVRDAGTSFYRGMRILPPDRRYAMYAIYAFCRRVDDIADDPGPAAPRRVALDGWRARITRLCECHPDADPLDRVLARAVAAFALRQEDFHAVIDGMAMDSEAIVAPTRATLDLYCDRVAGAVGRLSVRAFGDASAAADRVAGALGRALQFTNILRDIAEDSARGRLYLPHEYLKQYGVPADPEAALRHPLLPDACERLADDARARFAEATEEMRACDRRAMRPARLMAATYRAILTRLEWRGWRRLDRPVSVPRVLKLWLALRYGLL